MIPEAAIVTLLAMGAISANHPVTRDNWTHHPKIEAIRSLVKAIDGQVAAKHYKHEARTIECEDGRIGNKEAIDRDPSGRIRKLMRSFGSDDSAYRAFEYYDEAGRLRFVFATRGAAPTDSKDEFRLYFTEDGKPLWRDFRQNGPGYTWSSSFPDAFVFHDAELAWKQRTTCESLRR
jgi:hypothetical protein